MKSFVVLILASVSWQLASASDDALGARRIEDAETRSEIVVAELPPAEGGQGIRNQLAGFIEGSLARPFIPTELGSTAVAGLPAYYLRGVTIESGETFVALGLIVFADNRTHVSWARGDSDLSIERFAQLTAIAGMRHPDGEEIVREVAENSRASLSQLKQMAVQRHRAAFQQVQEEVRRGETAIELVRRAKADLAPDATNGDELNRRLRSAPPVRLYGWGSEKLGSDEYSVTFIYESDTECTMLVWIANTATHTCTNITADADRIAALQGTDQLNLPSDPRLLRYDPAYDMAAFRNSDYYRGRGTDALERPITD